MTLANNHLNDFKVKPINYTVDQLRRVGINSFGYTFGTAEENRPQVWVLKFITRNPQKNSSTVMIMIDIFHKKSLSRSIKKKYPHNSNSRKKTRSMHDWHVFSLSRIEMNFSNMHCNVKSRLNDKVRL